MAPKTAPEARTAIVSAAATLLEEEGPDAVTTRRVAADAGVHAPAIYRLFGDRDGLLEAVAEHAMAQRVTIKEAETDAAERGDGDPVAELRDGWRTQVEFALANPELFRLLSDPRRVQRSPAARAGRDVLDRRVHRVALAGRLAVPEPRAGDLLQATAIGTVQTLLSTPVEERDLSLVQTAEALAIGAVTTDGATPQMDGALGAAIVTVRAHAREMEALTPSERELLVEWLDRSA